MWGVVSGQLPFCVICEPRDCMLPMSLAWMQFMQVIMMMLAKWSGADLECIASMLADPLATTNDVR